MNKLAKPRRFESRKIQFRQQSLERYTGKYKEKCTFLHFCPIILSQTSRQSLNKYESLVRVSLGTSTSLCLKQRLISSFFIFFKSSIICGLKFLNSRCRNMGTMSLEQVICCTNDLLFPKRTDTLSLSSLLEKNSFRVSG